MKGLIRTFFISLYSLWLAPSVVLGFSYSGGTRTLVLAAAAFTAINLFVRPIIRLFFLPLNLLTLGFFSWMVNVIVLYILITLIPQIKIVAFDFPGFSGNGFIIPPMHLSFIFALIASSFVISFISSFLNWLAK